MTALTTVGSDADAEAVGALRRFHLAGESTPAPTSMAGLVPLQLAAFRDPSRLRFEYPLFLRASGAAGERVVCSLDALLTGAAEDSLGGGTGGALRDNLPRLERSIRAALTGEPARTQAGPVLERAAAAMTGELGLTGDGANELAAGLSALLAAVPSGGELLQHGDGAALELLGFAVEERLTTRRAAFRSEVEDHVRVLQALLDVERQKDPTTRSPEHLAKAVGSIGAQFLNAAVLAGISGAHRGTEVMAPDRRQRIEGVLRTLQDYLASADDTTVALIHRSGSTPPVSADSAGWIGIGDDRPCERATQEFATRCGSWALVFRAARIAALERDGRYDERHEAWFAGFDESAFSRDELLLVPPVVVYATADELGGDASSALSALLLSGLAVHVVVGVAPSRNPGAPAGDPLAGFRLELGHFGIAHREAFVQQSSAVRPEHLLDGYLCSLCGTRPALHVLTLEPEESNGAALPGWLRAGAAIESRAHALMRYDPEAGLGWARRFGVDQNPQPEEDWPLYTPPSADGGEPVAFTFADYALLDPKLTGHFRHIDDGVPEDAIVPIADYLSLRPDEAVGKVPFVRAVDGEGGTLRLGVTRRLVLSCQDRRAAWRGLRELAGVRNEHVEAAYARGRQEAGDAARLEIAALKTDHAAELERVRNDTASEAMERLAAALVGGTALASAPPPRAATPAPAAEAGEAGPVEEAAPEPPAAEPEDEDMGFDDPFIETGLCTSCNDCINLNSLLFVYDANKQARIGDPTKGTFEQLVRAAELCPAKCIFPGKPLNPDEPGLEALLERAARLG